MTIAFEEFPKIPRLKRDCVITEKIDGSNASVHIQLCTDRTEAALDYNVLRFVTGEDGKLWEIRAGSRTRWIRPGKDTDNFGFAAWVEEHGDELVKLGPGHHFGEWYGAGIQRTYGLDHKRFALFNSARWNPLNPNRPACCETVPVLYTGALGDAERVLAELKTSGSRAVPGFMRPEGIIVYHSASKQLFKAVLENDDVPKSLVAKGERKVRDPNLGGRRVARDPAYAGPERRECNMKAAA